MEQQKQVFNIPFDMYDFFGYLFPGIILIIYSLVFILITGLHENFISYNNILNTFSNLPWYIGFFVFLSRIIFVYVLGHAVGALGSIVFDRVLMSGMFGYPVITLLKLGNYKREYSEAIYRYLFFFYHLLVMLILLIRFNEKFYYISLFVVFIIVSLSILRIFIKWYKQFSDNEKIISIANNDIFKKIFLWVNNNILIPIEIVLKSLLRIDRSFPDDFIKQYNTIFKKSFNIDPKNIESENYWLSYFRAAAFNPHYASLIRTWLHLYGFSRNIATASYLTVTLSMIYVLLSPYHNTFALSVFIIITTIFGLLFFIRYWVLYHGYYTKSIIRAFVTSESTRSQ
jgi:hypothetical protein